MNKFQTKGLITVLIFLVVFSLIAFLPPFAMTAVFWISYIFGAVSILAQIYVMKIAFEGDGTAKSKFYGFPIAKIGVVYMIAQLILSIVFMIMSAVIPVWLTVLIFVILLAVAAVGLIAADTVRDEINIQDNKLKTNTSCMMTLRSIVYPLAGQCEEENAKKLLQELADQFRYSDPVSSEVLNDIESELEGLVGELQTVVSEVRYTDIAPLCKRVGNTLVERNRLCKLNKGK